MSPRRPRPTRGAGAHTTPCTKGAGCGCPVPEDGFTSTSEHAATSGGAHVRKGTRLPPMPRDTKSVVPSTSWRPQGIALAHRAGYPDRAEPGQGDVPPCVWPHKREMNAPAADPHQPVRRMTDDDAHPGVCDLPRAPGPPPAGVTRSLPGPAEVNGSSRPAMPTSSCGGGSLRASFTRITVPAALRATSRRAGRAQKSWLPSTAIFRSARHAVHEVVQLRSRGAWVAPRGTT